MKASEVRAALQEQGDPGKAASAPKFFKSGEGEYAEGDRFFGVTAPMQRAVAKAFRDLPLSEIERLLGDAIHECRSTALYILVDQYSQAPGDAQRAEIVAFYLDQLDRVNNWDLVDSSAHKILGAWLETRRSARRRVLDPLADSAHLWRERVAVLTCFAFIRQGEFEDILRLAEKFLSHRHDLIHKAVGWMLREMGKRDVGELRGFLNAHAAAMPRTMLRYAIEKLEPDERRKYLAASKR